MARDETVLASHPFDSGEVKVVRTTTVFEGQEKEHIDLLLCIGPQRPMRIPFRHGMEGMLKALDAGGSDARKQYTELIQRLNERTT